MMELFLTKHLHCNISPHRSFIDGLESYGLLEDYCDVFICCLDSYSHQIVFSAIFGLSENSFYQLFGLSHWLQGIHWASDVMLDFSKSVVMKKQTHLHLWCTRISKLSADFIIKLELVWILNETTVSSKNRIEIPILLMFNLYSKNLCVRGTIQSTEKLCVLAGNRMS